MVNLAVYFFLASLLQERAEKLYKYESKNTNYLPTFTTINLCAKRRLATTLTIYRRSYRNGRKGKDRPALAIDHRNNYRA